MIARRKLVQLLGAALIMPCSAFPQPAKKFLAVVLFPGDSENDERLARPFFEEMRRLGWTEGENIAYERLSGRGAREYVENLAKIAAELEPQLIYATSGTLALAAVKATGSVPVLFMTASDPVGIKLVASLARPGRNATGMYLFRKDLVARCVQLVREAFPHQTRIGAVFDRRAAEYERQRALHEEAARHAHFELAAVDFTNFEAIPKIFANFKREGTKTVVMTPSFTLVANRIEAGKFAARNGLALVAYRAEWADAGALLTYGPDGIESHKRCAAIANRILRGARPADTPVQQVSKLELIINLASAKALGLTLPRSVLARADRVIG